MLYFPVCQQQFARKSENPTVYFYFCPSTLCLQARKAKGGEHMNKLLKDLYDCFYTPPELAATKREIEECHRALIEALGKPERRLVLKIIDAKDHISEDTSLDSFISGFRLAWRMSAELNHYDDERPARCQAAEKPGARFTLKKEDDEQ